MTRRHNVKPAHRLGAQVNGTCGDTSTEGQDARARRRYDLFYIDNWSWCST